VLRRDARCHQADHRADIHSLWSAEQPNFYVLNSATAQPDICQYTATLCNQQFIQCCEPVFGPPCTRLHYVTSNLYNKFLATEVKTYYQANASDADYHVSRDHAVQNGWTDQHPLWGGYSWGTIPMATGEAEFAAAFAKLFWLQMQRSICKMHLTTK